MVLSLAVGVAQAVGDTPSTNRLVGVLQSGTFIGERLSGQVLPGGSDWQSIRSNGSILLDCRLVLTTTDGELISMKYTGIRVNPPGVAARIKGGEVVNPSEYYLRIAPVFETASEKYAWLNNVVAIGIGDRPPVGPTYSIFEVL
jgi:hypothetical protein